MEKKDSFRGVSQEVQDLQFMERIIVPTVGVVSVYRDPANGEWRYYSNGSEVDFKQDGSVQRAICQFIDGRNDVTDVVGVSSGVQEALQAAGATGNAVVAKPIPGMTDFAAAFRVSRQIEIGQQMFDGQEPANSPMSTVPMNQVPQLFELVEGLKRGKQQVPAEKVAPVVGANPPAPVKVIPRRNKHGDIQFDIVPHETPGNTVLVLRRREQAVGVASGKMVEALNEVGVKGVDPSEVIVAALGKYELLTLKDLEALEEEIAKLKGTKFGEISVWRELKSAIKLFFALFSKKGRNS